MTSDFFDKVCVKIEQNGNKGSGVLLQSIEQKFTYLVTALHCVDKSNLGSIIVNREIKGELVKLETSAIDIFDDISSDIAVIKLMYIDEVDPCMIAEVGVQDAVVVQGFPIAIDSPDSNYKRHPLYGKTGHISDVNKCLFISNSRLDAGDKQAMEVVSQYSGSGLFTVETNASLLYGIITNLSTPEGALNSMCGVSASYIQQKVIENKWEPFLTYENSSFEQYRLEVLDILDEPLDRICSVHMFELSKKITPYNIKQQLGEKLVFPYSDNGHNSKDLWADWLLYLALRSIENDKDLSEKNIHNVYRDNNFRRVKFIYSTDDSKPSVFVKKYLEEEIGNGLENDLVIMNSEKPPVKKIVDSSAIKKIVPDITNSLALEKGILIDEASSNIKNFTIVHFDKVVDDLNSVIDENYGLSNKEFEEKLGQRIGEFLYAY